MTREEAIQRFQRMKKILSIPNSDAERTKEAIDMAIEALAERPTESDFISKAKVLETYSELYWFDIDCGVVSKAEVDKIYERLQSLPSADRPTGEWVDDCTCSICHWMHEDNNGFALITKYNYCPNCGARMYKGGDSDG